MWSIGCAGAPAQWQPGVSRPQINGALAADDGNAVTLAAWQAGPVTLVLSIIYKAAASAGDTATDLAEDIATAADAGTAAFCAEFASVCDVVPLTTVYITEPVVTPVGPPTSTPTPPTPPPAGELLQGCCAYLEWGASALLAWHKRARAAPDPTAPPWTQALYCIAPPRTRPYGIARTVCPAPHCPPPLPTTSTTTATAATDIFCSAIVFCMRSAQQRCA